MTDDQARSRSAAMVASLRLCPGWTEFLEPWIQREITRNETLVLEPVEGESVVAARARRQALKALLNHVEWHRGLVEGK